MVLRRPVETAAFIRRLRCSRGLHEEGSESRSTFGVTCVIILPGYFLGQDAIRVLIEPFNAHRQTSTRVVDFVIPKRSSQTII